MEMGYQRVLLDCQKQQIKRYRTTGASNVPLGAARPWLHVLKLIAARVTEVNRTTACGAVGTV
mgnify:CR=1 FL=1